MAIFPPHIQEDWKQKIENELPGADVKVFRNPTEAGSYIEDANCAYGFVPPELFSRAKKLKWIQCYAAGPDPSFWYDALVNSDVVVTNFRGVYNDHVSAHALSFVLAFSRRLHTFFANQTSGVWTQLPPEPYLPESTALVIGVGGIGSETGRLCKAFGMTVIGIDPRTARRLPYFDELRPVEDLEACLPKADFVIITTPETPQTRKMFDSAKFELMKDTSYLINVGRGSCVVEKDLVDALERKKIAGAGLDVFEVEPLPTSSPLWSKRNVIITPHMAALEGVARVDERRTNILLENARRFCGGEELINVMDKRNWF